MTECKGSTDNGMRRSSTPCMNKAGVNGYCHVHDPDKVVARRDKKAQKEETARVERRAARAQILARLTTPDSRMAGFVDVVMFHFGPDAIHRFLDAHKEGPVKIHAVQFVDVSQVVGEAFLNDIISDHGPWTFGDALTLVDRNAMIDWLAENDHLRGAGKAYDAVCRLVPMDCMVALR